MPLESSWVLLRFAPGMKIRAPVILFIIFLEISENTIKKIKIKKLLQLIQKDTYIREKRFQISILYEQLPIFSK
jgi:hypothetical protein